MKRSNNNVLLHKKVVFQSNSVGKLPIPYITNQFGKHHMCFDKFSDHSILDNKQCSKSVSQIKVNSALSSRSMLGVTRCSTPPFTSNSYSQKVNTTVCTSFQTPSLIVHRRVQSMNTNIIQKYSVKIKKC